MGAYGEYGSYGGWDDEVRDMAYDVINHRMDVFDAFDNCRTDADEDRLFRILEDADRI